MQSKFGIKDFVLLLAVMFVGLLTFLAMKQGDRSWERQKGTDAKLGEIESSLARMQRQLDASNVSQRLDEITEQLASGIVVQGSGNTGNSAGSNTGASWTRPGYKVDTTGDWGFTNDPLADENASIGGEFIEIFEGQPPKITAYTYADVYGRRISDRVIESLGSYDPVTLELRGRLAESWQYDPDGMWLRVKLRDRARFSDGAPVTAEDVRWTYEDLLFNQEIEAERFRSVYNAIEDVEVISDKVVEFTFKEPRFDNLSQAFGFGILPKHIYEPWIESPAAFNRSTGLVVGSGPFKLERVSMDDQWTPPDNIVLVRNDLYWADRPVLDSIRYKSISDELARLTDYSNGGGDMMRPSAVQYTGKQGDESFESRHDFREWYNMQGGYSFIAWQCGPRNGSKLTPFHDVRVRQAMTMIIDRDRLRRDISKNLARPATGPFLSSTPQADPEIEQWPHDPQRAIELLAEAGWIDRDGDRVLENERGDEFSFEITFGNGSDGTLRMVSYLKDVCAGVGIRCELRPVDWSIISSILNNRDFDAITFVWSASAPESDPNQIWHSNSIANQGDNFIQWASADADRYIEEGRRTLDAEARMKVWHKLHRVFHEEQPYTFMSELPWLRFTTKRVQNMQEYNSGLVHDEIWLAPSGSVPMPN
jgi:peptide/nickel transport system substrate-binding protein